jgi:glyoxylase-like metal-dependent hydrolase (beta-lactamase superfamily II)
MEPYRITKEIFQVGGGRLTSPQDAAIYLINIDGHGALVDAGCGSSISQLIKNIQACGLGLENIELLLITHCHFDHAGGVKGLKDAIPHCVVVAHESDALYLEKGDNTVTAARWYDASIEPFTVDRKLKDPEEDIILGDRIIKALHVPGHSPGSLVYVVESEWFKVLFGQDVHGPLEPSLKSDKADYKKSLELLLSLKADILCEGHYGIIEGKEEVREFIRSFL